MNIGQSIRLLRIDKAKERQNVFSINIGITQSYLSQIENGQKKASTELLEKIANYLQIPLPILFWFGVEEKDIRPHLTGHFRFIKPSIDKMLESII